MNDDTMKLSPVSPDTTSTGGCDDCKCENHNCIDSTPAMHRKTPDSVIGTFMIPEEIAVELNSLIPRVTILKDLLLSAIDSPTRFESIEAKLIPIQDRYTTLKNMITYQYVPAEFCNPLYSWSYPGYDITRNVCWVEKN